MTDSASSVLSGADDWPTFRVDVQIELRREGVFTLLEHVILAPTAADAFVAAAALISLPPGNNTPGAPAPASVAGVAFKDTPAERNSRALGIIQKFLSAELRIQLVDENNAGILWAKLREKFEEENRADSAMGALGNLFHTKLVVEGDPELMPRIKIQDHITLITKYFDRLARLGYPFSPDLQPLILLSTLPEDAYWTGIRGNIVSSIGTGLTLTKVTSRLLALGKRPGAEVDDDESALAANSKSNKTKSSGVDKHCIFHGQNKSHTTEQCHNLKNMVQEAKKGKSKSGKQRKRGSKANKASTTSDSESDDEDNANLAIASVSHKFYAAMSAY
ncbi:hypothetical protein C8R45DRAFT_807797, partial [Mycena sanguinolenta]